MDFRIVCGYGVWHFWSIDVDDSETVVVTCVNMQVLKYIAVIWTSFKVMLSVAVKEIIWGEDVVVLVHSVFEYSLVSHDAVVMNV